MKMTNRKIMETAAAQSALEQGCRPEDFFGDEPVFRDYGLPAGARAYFREPLGANLVSYGNAIVAASIPLLRPAVESFVRKYGSYRCFETPNLHVLDDGIRPLGYVSCFMAEYFLPDAEKQKELPCPYAVRMLTEKDFSALYLPEWSNALCDTRKSLDRLAFGAYDGDRLVGLAGASEDCASMWQIGIDVLPDYRRRGIARALTSRLSLAVMELGKVPFYCAAWSNLGSVKNALSSGFYPAWTELTVKPQSITDGFNV